MSRIEHTVGDGKYTVIFDDSPGAPHQFVSTRYGEPWRDLCGDGMVLAMLHEIDELKAELYKLREATK
jgi:hypothetical protein